MTDREYEVQIKELEILLQEAEHRAQEAEHRAQEAEHRAQEEDLAARQWADVSSDYERQLIENEKEIAKLKGMIEAFKFCIARGNLKNDR